MSKESSELPQVFHEGEVSMHKSLGIEDVLEKRGKKMIRDYMPDQHRDFFEQLKWVHLGAIDSQGHPWSVVRTGNAGFMTSPNNKVLNIQSEPLAGEPKDLQLFCGDKISIVGLDPSNRRRNRLNATVVERVDNDLRCSVDQSYGNCPKYIQQREITPASSQLQSQAVVSGHTMLDQTDTDIVTRADTLFIASRAKQLNDDPRSGVDINHRGGLPGFITVLDNTTILVPDYKGNNFFNTFGNILQDSRVGVQIVDFSTSTLLNLQGRAEIITIDDSQLKAPDMGRRVRITIEGITRSNGVFPFCLSNVEYSPFLTPDENGEPSLA